MKKSKSKSKARRTVKTPQTKVVQKEFVISFDRISVSFEVLIVNEVSIYDDTVLKAFNPNMAKHIEKLLDEKIALFTGNDEMEHVALLK